MSNPSISHHLSNIGYAGKVVPLSAATPRAGLSSLYGIAVAGVVGLLWWRSVVRRLVCHLWTFDGHVADRMDVVGAVDCVDIVWMKIFADSSDLGE